ncbi:MAG: archaetidylserine synthase [Methanobacterium sp.]|uniref:archaetidylserine synthase n=1 Tax=Methanobacterium sp. TaxID=2164 RepID=UPI003D656CFD|nr:archaetidylserine synthase [Methanobacterium sp.]
MNIRHYTSVADLVSIANASSGFLSIVMITMGNLVLAAKFILLAVIFDALDGWVARKINREDEYGFGKNIDSLSDIISFGVAPAMLLYMSYSSFGAPYLNLAVALLIVICGLLRLSRFNVITDASDDKFIGLPIPVTALVLGSFFLSGLFQADIALVIMGIVSLLMISTINYPKFRDIKIVAVSSILVVATLLPQNFLSNISYLPAKLLFIIILLYLIVVPIIDLYTRFIRSGPNVR